MNTIKAGVKALHLDTGMTEMFSTVREAAEHMALYRISEQQIRNVLGRGAKSPDQVRGWTFAYVNEPFKVTDSSGRVRIRERRMFASIRKFRWADQTEYTYDPFKWESYYGVTMDTMLWFINHFKQVNPKMTLEELATYADSGKEICLYWSETVDDFSEYVQVSWAD